MANDLTNNEDNIWKSVGYWAVVYAISIPVLFVVIGLIVRATLGAFS